MRDDIFVWFCKVVVKEEIIMLASGIIKREFRQGRPGYAILHT